MPSYNLTSGSPTGATLGVVPGQLISVQLTASTPGAGLSACQIAIEASSNGSTWQTIDQRNVVTPEIYRVDPMGAANVRVALRGGASATVNLDPFFGVR